MKTAIKFTLAATAVAVLTACGGGGGSENSTAPSANTAPVANAGEIQNILVGAAVTLNGSNSSDANNDALTYSWTLTSKPSGSTAALNNATSAMPTFTADVAGAYVASLVVNDGKEDSLTKTVTVNATVANAAPVANAGATQNVTSGSTVTLNGSNSSDANNDALTYSWTFTIKPAGSSAVLSNATSATPTFTADLAGAYVASLVVNDGQVSSTAATVSITASVANAAPVANAGAAQNVTTGSSVTLNGSNSSDANNDALTYSWTLTSRPTGSTATLNNATSATPTFTADLAGAYVASLVVNDGKVSSTAATVVINVTQAINALAQGAGTFAQQFPSGSFYKIDETTGLITNQASICSGFSAADIKPDGKVAAVSINKSTVTEIDVVSGACREIFTLPEPMIAIAVADDGSIVTISQEKIFNARQIYRFNASGGQLSKVSANGESNITGIGDFTSPSSIDFGPDGKLYATSLSTVWEVNLSTGAGTLKAVGIQTTGDIDIDAGGVLRTISFGALRKYSINDWSLISERTLERDIFGFSSLVKR